MWPQWLKSTGLFLLIMILWDCARLFIQAKVNQLFLSKNFQNIRKDLDDIEEDLEDIGDDVDDIEEDLEDIGEDVDDISKEKK